MEYVGRAPAAPLDRFIDDIYVLSGVPRHRRLNVPPMPSAHLMLNLAAPVRLYDSDPLVPPAVLTGGWFMGVWTRRFVIEHQRPVRVVGVHFKPWGLSAFVDAPSAELRDRCVPIEALWGPSSNTLCDRIAGASSTSAMHTIVEAELRSRLAEGPSRGFDLVSHAARRLATSWGAMPVGTLTDRAGISRNYLAAQFKSHVGVTPKRVARIYRFARLILSVDATHPVDWTQLATAAGYFDQAHFSKEFKEFTGHNPTDYLTLRRRFPADETFPPDNGPMPDE
ncbi:helix-turn-helix domain-containing protein [Flexivirga alba]|uniref:Helix-turn-helix domain-containing protein n=1 Tax=Flexivirga alba TaxID=702742 RepID=A0ABW2ADV8_9MICO